MAKNARAANDAGMNISLRQLKAFLGVADSANFTKTAQNLHLSQAALSATIRELESQLNARLFERTTRAVVLTDAGRAFLPTATLIEQELTAAALRLRNMEQHEIATLRVGFTPLMASQIVPELLVRFAQAHPTVKVEVIDNSPTDIQQQVESGALDAAFGAFFAKLSGLRRVAILPSHLVAVQAAAAQRGRRAARKTETAELHWKALDEQALICLTPESPIQQLVESAIFKHKLTLGERTTVQHLETAISMAEKGFGTAIIPSFAQSACARYAVHCSPLVPRVSFDFYCITRAGAVASPTLAEFTRMFEELAREPEMRP